MNTVYSASKLPSKRPHPNNNDVKDELEMSESRKSRARLFNTEDSSHSSLSHSFITSPSSPAMSTNGLNMIRSGNDLNNSSIITSLNIGQMALEHQLEAAKSELQRERNSRRLDKVKSEQIENRLNRQVQFLREEAEQSRALLDEVRAQSETDLEQLSQSRKKALRNLEATETQNMQLQLQLQQYMQDNTDSTFWRKKSEQLANDLEAISKELQQLKTMQMNSIQKSQNILTNSLQSVPKNENNGEVTPDSQVVKELHQTRIILSDAERNVRMQARKVEKLESQLQATKPKLNALKSCQDKIVILERENKDFRNEREMMKVLEIQWAQFRKDLDEIFDSDALDDKKSIHIVPDINDEKKTVQKTHPLEISTIVRHLRSLRETVYNKDGELESKEKLLIESKRRIVCLEGEVKTRDDDILSLHKEKTNLEEKIALFSMEVRKCKAQESISQREAESLQLLLGTFNVAHEKSAHTKNQNEELLDAPLRLSLSTSQDKYKALLVSHDELKEEMNKVIEEKKNLHNELDRVKDKFVKLREALMKEKEKVENAEERACEAENLMCRGSYNSETTRVLHLQKNPFIDALRSKYESEIQTLKNHIQNLQGSKSPSAASTASCNKTPTGSSIAKKSPSSSTSSLDAQKLNQRLKESFKEQISLFREGVYLLTGFKVDMTTEKERPFFKVRSMYAEKEEDFLMFRWPHKLSEGNHNAITSLDLLDSEFAQELSMTEAFGYMTKFKSIPAFMGSLTLNLFEKQTFMG